METTQIIVLPGLDGTDLLLDRFREYAPPAFEMAIASLPDNPDDDYVTLCDYLSARIRNLDSCHIVAQSFSGPLAILLAHRHPDIVHRLTLVASFATSPIPFIGRFLPWSLLFRLPMPSLMARRFFVGADSSIIPALKNAIRQTSPPTLVQRIHCLMNVDVTSHLSELDCALTYIRPTQDRLVSKSAVNTIVGVNKSVVVREIDGPHLILQTRPKQAWASILR